MIMISDKEYLSIMIHSSKSNKYYFTIDSDHDVDKLDYT